MKLTRILSAVALAALPSCTLTTDCVCVSGPNKGQTMQAKFFTSGSGSGSVAAVAPWGETAKGRYLTQTGGASSRAWAAKGEAFGNKTSTEGDSATITAGMGSAQVGTAMLIGDQGTSWDIIYWCSGLSPLHGQGGAKDTRGNYYRMIW